ncbi:MAG: hypothetical protein K8W52_41805 [Deltaproteobacteria bacterium]|nr:hypothetical protein [Deltaproteobacteria bacterium]
MRCPICDKPTAQYAARCDACGADLMDPDVRALAGLAAPAPAGSERAAQEAAAHGGTASLARDRYFGVSAAGLASGQHLAWLAWIGGLALAATFLAPLDPDFRGLRAPWNLLDEGRTVALIVPLLFGAIGLEIAVLSRKVPVVARAGVLVGGGLLAIALGQRGIAEGAGMPETGLLLPWLGAAVAGTGIVARLLRPLDRHARWVILAGAALFAVGMLVPIASTNAPFECAWFQNAWRGAAPSRSVAAMTLDLMDHATIELQLVMLLQLAPFALLPLAFALAWKAPTGAWDRPATALRPVGWVIVLFAVLAIAMLAFGATSYTGFGGGFEWDRRIVDSDTLGRALIAGRLRLALLAFGGLTWFVGGATALFLRFAPAPKA